MHQKRLADAAGTLQACNLQRSPRPYIAAFTERKGEEEKTGEPWRGEDRGWRGTEEEGKGRERGGRKEGEKGEQEGEGEKEGKGVRNLAPMVIY